MNKQLYCLFKGIKSANLNKYSEGMFIWRNKKELFKEKRAKLLKGKEAKQKALQEVTVIFPIELNFL